MPLILPWPELLVPVNVLQSMAVVILFFLFSFFFFEV